MEATNDSGCTPLSVAALYTNRAVAEVLIAHKAELNAPSRGGVTPLAAAALKGDEAMTMLLLNSGADSSIPDSSDFTPLHTAVEHGHRRVVEALLAHGADPNLAASRRPGAVAHRRRSRRPRVTPAPVGQGRVSPRPITIGNAAELGGVARTQRGRQVSSGSGHGAKRCREAKCHDPVALGRLAGPPGPRAFAPGTCSLGKCHILLDKHAPQRGRGWTGAATKVLEQNATYIPSAFRQVHLEVGSDADYAAVVGLLLAAKADVNARETAYQGTPLFTAVQAGNLPAVEALLVAGADVSARNSIGETPLHSVSKSEAAASVVSNIVVRLLKAGAAPDARDDRRATPLHAAAYGGKPEAAALLIAAGASVNAAGPNLLTPLLLAVHSGNRQCVELLLSKGADPERRNHEGATALHLAVAIQSKDLVTLLLQHDADVNAAGLRGATALMESTKVGEIGMMKLLLEHGAKIDATNQSGWTALHVVAANGQFGW